MHFVAWAFKQVVSTRKDSIVLSSTLLSEHRQASRTCLVLSLLFGKFSAIRAALLAGAAGEMCLYICSVTLS